MDTEVEWVEWVEWVEEMLATGLSDGADKVVLVAATNRATVVVLSDGRVGSAVGSNVLRLGTEVGKVSSISIASLV